MLDIVYRDDDYVAIAKPAGLVVIPGRGERTSALEQLARQLGLPHSGGFDPRLRVVHRIDKETSGIVLFALNRAAQQHVSHQFQNNEVEKQYLALVTGSPGEDRGEIDASMARHRTSPQRMAISKHGRPARTVWEVIQRFRGLTLMRIHPKTGKTHQIRVHLKSIGLPLAIDPLYHPVHPPATPGLLLSSFKRAYRPSGRAERPLIQRLTLHAERIAFRNMAGQRVEIAAQPPKDFRAAVKMLAKYARA